MTQTQFANLPTTKEIRHQLTFSDPKRGIDFVGLYHNRPFEVEIKKVNNKRINYVRKIRTVQDFLYPIRRAEDDALPVFEDSIGQKFNVFGLAGIHPKTGKAVVVLTPVM